MSIYICVYSYYIYPGSPRPNKIYQRAIFRIILGSQEFPSLPMDKIWSTLDFLGVTMELVYFQAHGSRSLNLHLKKRLHPGWRSNPYYEMYSSSLEILPNSNSNQQNTQMKPRCLNLLFQNRTFLILLSSQEVGSSHPT